MKDTIELFETYEFVPLDVLETDVEFWTGTNKIIGSEFGVVKWNKKHEKFMVEVIRNKEWVELDNFGGWKIGNGHIDPTLLEEDTFY